MKTKNISILLLIFLAAILTACSFTTANISDLKFGKNDKANPPTTNFNVGEKVYVVCTVSNAMGKHKLKYKITVPGQSAPLEKDVNFEGSNELFLDMTPTAPGDFKVETILMDESGKEIGKKSGTFSVKGAAAPPASTETKKDDADSDSEDKPSEDKSPDK